MKRAISLMLSLFLIVMLVSALTGCGADIKAENEKLKAENTNLKSDNDKSKLEIQKLKEEIQKGAEKEATIVSLTAENEALKKTKEDNEKYIVKIYSNGDTKKQLLARSRHLVFKPSSKWSKSQKERSEILFTEFPKIKEAYGLSMMFRNCYELSKTQEEAKKRFNNWYDKINESDIREFDICVNTVKVRENTILNYFTNRSTNAGAESFNAKIKGFRSLVRGVSDKKIFLFRIFKIYG